MTDLMPQATPVSPLFDLLGGLQPAWEEGDQGALPKHFGDPAGEAAQARVLGVADVSCQRRWGGKGPGAAAWLAGRGLPVPETPNTWAPLAQGGRVLRLGRSEFLVEGPADPLEALCLAEPGVRVYPVLRQDAALMLQGEALPSLLAQVCSVNFASLDLAARPVVLTSMAGVTVTVLPGTAGGLPQYRLWCDGTYGPYLWRTLTAIAAELGGGPVGLDALAS